MEFSYGVDRPEDVADLCEKYGEAEKAEGDVRNVTVTTAPGTELEKDYAITVPFTSSSGSCNSLHSLSVYKT